MVKINKPEECEVITVKITEETTPIAFREKMAELTEQGMTEEEARKVIYMSDFVLELYYSKGQGLFAIESEACECVEVDLYDPYTGEKMDNSVNLK